MRKFFNRRLLFVFVAAQFITFVANGQLSHFLYLQTDNKQPFYVKYNNKIISSTGSGYIILSKLNDGVINFSLGFPQSNELEQKFTVTIDKTEKGCLIKNFADKGWGLFDLQSSVITYAQTNQTQATTNLTTTTTTPANDPFTKMLSTVTQDSTVKNVTLKKEEKPVVIDTPKPQPVIVKVETIKKEEAAVVKQEEPKNQDPLLQMPKVDTSKKLEPVVQQPVVQEIVWVAPSKTSVQRIRRFDSREGSDIVFEVIEANGVRDTIRLFIAADSSVTHNPTSEINPSVKEQKQDTIVVTPLPQSDLMIIPEVKKEELKLDTPLVKKEETKTEIKTQTTKPAVIPNSNCKDEATEDDFLKLRKRMAAQNTEESMVNEAKKAFKIKCFSTMQLKNLAVLFLTDEGRYRFYDAALPFVIDFGTFKTLSDTITDDYFKKRFLALFPN